jgi:endonuclease G
MNFRYLSDQQLKELQQALVEANLFRPEAQDAMRSSIVPFYQAMLPISTLPNVQLTLTLNQLNRVHNLVDGDVPLAQFLDVAAILATGTRAAGVIERMLDIIRYSGTVPASAPTIAAGPAPFAAAGGAGGGDGFNTDVELQAQTGALDQTVSVRFLRDGVTAAASVVKLLVHRHMGGHAEFLDGDQPRLANGTGWIIAPGLLITNHHVINARRKEGIAEPDATAEDFRLQAEHTQILFDYVTSAVPAPVKAGPAALLYADKELDFALLRLPEGAPSRPPLRLRTHAIRKTPIQALGIGVNLLQHPNGDPMRLGFRNNYVVLGDDRWLSYLTDTAIGSSGSPVCDDAWTVAALHSGSRPIEAANIEILGQKFRRENYGIPITTLMAHLQERAPALSTRITTGQKALR